MFIVKTRTASFLFVLAIYTIAFFVGLLVFNPFYEMHLLIYSFLADMLATLIVWSFGLLFKNSSVYDPYWSIAPIIILTFWIIIKGVSLSNIDILYLIAIIVWGIRLTLNWAIRWKGLQHQDWRYSMLKEKSPHLWFLTNLIGINIMPTIMVFVALIPAYYGIGPKVSINSLVIIGFAICIFAVLIQSIADMQMDLFRKNKSYKNQYIDRGLWRYSRHPNYFGEVSFWWGIWLMQMGANPKIWISVIGPTAMTFLFIFVSIPMMEKHILVSRPTYIRYRRQVSMLIPWFRIKQ